MRLRTHLILFLAVFAFEANRVVGTFGNSAPAISDLLEVHNIAWNLANGRGYQFDWDDPQWRRSLHTWTPQEDLGFILARRSSHPTMFRPPLTPLIVAGLIRLFPQHSFAAWRTFDCAAFGAAACLLCDIAFASGGLFGLATMLALLLFDPLLRIFVPGCWTEGLAFDLVTVLIWLLASPHRLPGKWNHLLFGVSLGLLCLDRAVFLLSVPPLGLLWAVAAAKPPARFRMAAFAMATCLMVQLPWWVRNVSISSRFLPLGTQGGFNLPDEYGDVALTHGSWTGKGMALAWTPLSVKDSDICPPAGFTDTSFESLCPGDRRTQNLFAATFCTSIESEIAVNDCGTRAARRWIRSNYREIPRLMLLKLKTLPAFFHPLVITSGVLALVGFIALAESRRLLTYAALVAACYAFAVSLTHVVLARFLVPLLPMIFLADAAGVAGIARLMAKAVRSVHRGKLAGRADSDATGTALP